MSVAYGFVFLVLAVMAGLSTAGLWNDFGWPLLALGYLAVSLALLSAAYFGAGPRVFLKLKTGRIPATSWALFGPYYLLNLLIFWLYRVASSEPASARLLPNLYFGRRLSPHEAQSVIFVGVLDLAAEFSEVATLRTLPGYRSMPVLDATAPSRRQLDVAVDWLTQAVDEGPVYVHCAMGHGRTVCVVIAYLLYSGAIGTVAEGVRLMREQRPGVRLNRVQREILRPYEADGRTTR